MKTFYSSLSAIILLLTAPLSWAGLSFDQAFGVSRLDAGNNTSLTFTIQNTSPADASWDITFDSSLPAGLRVSDVPGQRNTCGGIFTVDKALGGISLSGGRLAAGESCQVQLNVTSDVANIYTSTSGLLQDQSGDFYGNTTAELTVVDAGLDFSLAVDSPVAELGETVLMTYHIQGTGGIFSSIQFSHQFPNGLKPRQGTVPVRSGVCSGASTSLTEDAFTFSGVFLTDTPDCEVTIEMEVVTTGDIELQTSNIQYSGTPSPGAGFAATVVSVQPRILNLKKTVQTDSVLPGQPFDVTYRLSNNSRSDTLTSITFSDDLDATIPGLTVVGAPASQACGSSSILSWDAGSGLATLSGGTLASEESCEFTLTLQAPPGVSEGEYSHAVQASANSSSGVVLSQEVMTPIPVIAKPLLDISLSQSVFADEVDVTYTVTNTSNEYSLSNFSFQDVYTSAVTSMALKSGSNTCVQTPSFSTYNPGPSVVFNATTPLASMQSCEFTFTFTLAPGSSGLLEGAFVSAPSGETGGSVKLAHVQRETGRMVTAPSIRMMASPDQVVPGELFDINVSITNGDGYPADQDEYADYTNLALTFDSGGLVDLVGLTEACPGATQTGDTLNIPFLNAGEACQLTQQATATAAASGRNVQLSLTNITAQTQGQQVSGPDLVGIIRVSGLLVDTLAQPSASEAGQRVALTLNLQNASDSEAIADLSYQERVGRYALPFSFVANSDTDICGLGSNLTVNANMLQLTSVSLAPGEQCQIPVDIMLDGAASAGLYRVMQGNLSYTESGNNLVIMNKGVLFEVLPPGGISDISEQRNINEPNPDNDPFDTETEQLAGDLNGDGTADAVQSFIASTISPLTGRPVGLEVEPQCTINSFEMVTAASLGNVPPGVSFPEGMASFSISCAKSTVRLYLPGADFSGNQGIRKYGPRAPDFAGGSEWYELPTSRIDSASEMIEFVLTDNALGDSNPAVGVISDPIGLAKLPPAPTSQRAIPVAGIGWIVFLSLQIVLVGGYMRRKRRI